MPYKLDKTKFANEFGLYQTYFYRQIPIQITGSLANNRFKRYQTVYNFTNEVALGRSWIENEAGLKAPFNVGTRLANVSPSYEIYDAAGNEVVQTDLHYEDTLGELVVTLLIINTTGATINLIDQTLTVTVEFYDVPVG